MSELIDLNDPPISESTPLMGLRLPVMGNPLSHDLDCLRDSLLVLDAAVHSKVTNADIIAAIAALTDTAPATLDTLRELADAIGNDPDFAANIASQVASMLAAIQAIQTALPGKMPNQAATAATLGGIKVGGGLSIDANAVLSVTSLAFSAVTGKPTTLSGYGITDGAPLRKPARVVNTTSGSLGAAALNAVNVIAYPTQWGQELPANPQPSDEVTVVITNGRSDNILKIDSVVGSQRPIMGLNQDMTLDDPFTNITMIYLDPARGWWIKQ